MKALHKRWYWLALIIMTGMTRPAHAQLRQRAVEEPQWFKMQISEVDAGAYAEGTFEDTTYKNAPGATHSRLFVGPTVGLNLNGSVYHPYLFRYQLNGDGAYGWAQDTIHTAQGTSERNELAYLGRFQGSADLLGNKPYRANIFGGYDHTFRDYDFFSRVTVDQSRYGALMSYDLHPLSLSAGYTHRDEQTLGLTTSTVSHDDTINLNARHEREKGGTSVNYAYNQFSREDLGRGNEGRNQSVSLGDTERFGGRNQYKLQYNASYSQREASGESDNEILTGANLEAEHRENLSSFYDVGYDRFKLGNFESDNYRAHAELRHQLYASLTSTLIAQATDSEGQSDTGSTSQRRLGGGFTESYTKRLGEEHHLRINNSLLFEQVDQRVSQQSLTLVRNEAQTFDSGGRFVLHLPNVVESSIVVLDQARIITFLRGIDYDVIQNGTLTFIERRSGSTMPQSVVVDYSAAAGASGTYQAIYENFYIRFDLWNSLWGVYARLNYALNNANRGLYVQNIKDYVVGTDFHWKWATAGAEYEIYDSDQSKFRAAHLLQGFAFRLDDASSLALNLRESWTDYVDAHRQEKDYRFTSQYHRALTRHLGLDVAGGTDLRRGQGVNQDLATFRANLDFKMGKLSIHAGYDYEYNLFLNNERRQKHLFLARVTRVF